MCRSIKILRRPDEPATTGEVEAAARQFVRKVSGYQLGLRSRDRRDRPCLTPPSRGDRRDRRGRPGSLDSRPRPVAPPPRAARRGRSRSRLTARRPVSTDARALGGTAPAPDAPDAADRPWWARPGLEVVDRRLAIAGRDAEALAREHGTPLFVYDRRRLTENASRLIAALDRAGLRHRVRFALKANPDPEALSALHGLVGIDACSPGEILRALECGWSAEDISYTGTNVSERDLDVVLAHPVHVNLDAISQIERVGRRLAADGRPGRSIGLRINPGAGAGYNSLLAYSGSRPTKFGIYEERLDEALAAAARHRMTIDTV